MRTGLSPAFLSAPVVVTVTTARTRRISVGTSTPPTVMNRFWLMRERRGVPRRPRNAAAMMKPPTTTYTPAARPNISHQSPAMCRASEPCASTAEVLPLHAETPRTRANTHANAAA